MSIVTATNPTSTALGELVRNYGLVDWQHLSYQASEGENGAPANAIRIALPAVPPGRMRVVQRIFVSTDSGTDTELRVFVGSPETNNLVSGSSAGNLNEAEYPQGLIVPAGVPLTLEWTGASADARATARIQFADFVQVRG